MNRHYRIVFNQSLGLWQAVSETAKAHGKSATEKGRSQRHGVLSLALLPALAVSSVWADVAIDTAGNTVDGSSVIACPPAASTCGPSWAVGGSLTIGDTATGTLTIENGGTVNNTQGDIGNGADGSVIVTGSGSTWTNSGVLRVGINGTASLTIADGGTLSNTDGFSGFIGFGADSDGSATVSGSGSAWESSGELIIGFNGTGSLAIENGGTASNTNGGIGYGTNSNGSVSVTGSDSTWANSGVLYVGINGTGNLAIADGGTVSNTTGYIGAQANGNGSVIVTGSDSTWTNSDHLYVGFQSTGSLTIADGGTVTNNDFGVIGSGAGGSVSVTGIDSTWATAGELIVGLYGNGILTIENGGTVSNTIGYIGYEPGSTGSVSVTGSDSTWASSDELIVGDMGSGNLAIAGGGTASNTTGYIGYWNTSNGSVSVTGSDSTWTNSDHLYIGLQGNGSLTIADGGTVSVNGGTVSLGDAVGASGALNFGNHDLAAPSTAGTLNADAITSGAGSGTVNFNQTDTLTLTMDITGNTVVNQRGIGTTVLIGDNTYTGATTISGGTLAVNGSIVSATTVAAGGTLGGSGTLGDVTVQNGGILAPGNSIGTLTVDGDVTFDAGSTLEIEANPDGSSDRLIATGHVELGGATLAVLAAAGTWATQTGYDIIQAGSLNGSFATVTSNLAFLTPQLNYSATGVELWLLRNSIDFATVAATRNQRATATALESLGNGATLYDAITGLDTVSARAAYDNLSGEIHASTQGALLDDSRHLRQAIVERLRGTQGQASTSATLHTDADSGLSFWLHGYGAWSETDGDGNAARLDHDSRGVLFGLDLPLDATWRLGLSAGLGRSDLDAGGRASSADVDSRFLAAYVGGQWGALNLRLGLGHAWHAIDSRRDVQVAALGERATASYDARTRQVFGELGYALQVGDFSLEPFLGLAHVEVDSDAFRERGGATALRSDDERQRQDYASLGLHAASAPRELAGVPVSLSGSLAWQHAFGEREADRHLAFAGSDPFRVQGVPLARNSAVATLGLQASLGHGITLKAGYAGQFAGDYRDHGLRLGLSLPF